MKLIANKAGSPLGEILRAIESFRDDPYAVEPISFVEAKFFADEKFPTVKNQHVILFYYTPCLCVDLGPEPKVDMEYARVNSLLYNTDFLFVGTPNFSLSLNILTF